MILRSSLLTLVIVASLSGCAAAPEPEPAPTSTPEPTPTVIVPPAPPIGVVGSGSLAGVPFTVEWDGTKFGVFGLGGRDLPLGERVYLTVDSLAEGHCVGNVYRLDYGLDGLPAEIGLPIDGASTSADATYLHGISQLTQLDELRDGCMLPVVASSTINWSMAPLYPDLQVTDSGETGGARGTVTLDGTTPVAYLVRQGDVFAEVAARFGLSDAELFWLNPRRSDPGVPSLIKEEALNLSPSRR